MQQQDLWAASVGEKFEAWYAELREQAIAVNMHLIGIEIFRPLATESEAVLMRTLYIAPNLSNIPSFIGPFKRDTEAPKRFVRPDTKEGPIIEYYVVRK